jgi:tetratricopeptide (TPR) repeat protein
MKIRGQLDTILSTLGRLGCVACWMGAAGAAQADIITYHNGKELKGISMTLIEEPDVIIFSNATLSMMRIPKGRVAKIEQEPETKGWTHIGMQHMESKNFREAMKAFKQASDLDPNNNEAQRQLKLTQSLISKQEQTNRAQSVDEINLLITRSQELITAQKFEEASKLLRDADRLVPNEEQLQRLPILISDMYYKWAEERLDKYDRLGGEEKLKLALAANPENDQVIEKILSLWKNDADPEKKLQVANVYETMLDRHGEDNALRKELADLYYDLKKFEDAARHYLHLFSSSDQFQGTQLEERLFGILDRLHLQYARLKDYDKAIDYFNMLARINPQFDPTEVVYYQYLKQSNMLTAEDKEGQLQLALFSEKNRLDEEALRIYRSLLANKTTQAQARAGINRFAKAKLGQAVNVYERGDYALSITLTNQIIKEFPQSQVIDAAANLAGKAQVEANKQRLYRQELAEDRVRLGNEYYRVAESHFEDLFSTVRKALPRLLSSRTEAKNFYRYAIVAYLEAIRIDPSLATDSNSIVNVRLSDSHTKLRRLNQRADRFRKLGPVDRSPPVTVQ